MRWRLERTRFFLLNRVIFLKAAVHSAAPPGCRGAHDVWGARFLLAATNVNQSSLQLYVTMPIRVI
jgi:hypothetical protein